MQHNFDIDIAEKYGVDEAIMINNLAFWILKNQASEKHYYDGHYWTYNSAKAFEKLFPYWSKKQIYRIINSLKKKGVIKDGNYNKIKYDQTKWYTITEKTVLLKYKLHFTKREIGKTEMVTPIPDSNTNSKHIDEPDFKKSVRIHKNSKELPLNTEEEILEPCKEETERKKAIVFKALADKGQRQAITTGDKYNADGKSVVKKSSRKGWQTVYDELRYWEQDWGRRKCGDEGYVITSALPQCKALRRIRTSLKDTIGKEEFKELIKEKMELLVEQDWIDSVPDFLSLASNWHRLSKLKKNPKKKPGTYISW